MKNSTGSHLTVLSSINTLLEKRKAITIYSPYIPKSDHKTPQVGHFWSSCAGEYKRGWETIGSEIIDIYKHEALLMVPFWQWIVRSWLIRTAAIIANANTTAKDYQSLFYFRDI